MQSLDVINQSINQETEIALKRASNSEIIIHEAPVATKATPGHGSKLEAQKSDEEENLTLDLKELPTQEQSSMKHI